MIDIILFLLVPLSVIFVARFLMLPAILERRAQARQNQELDAFADAYLRHARRERRRLRPFEKWLRGK